MDEGTFSSIVVGMFRRNLERWRRNQEVASAYEGDFEGWEDQESGAKLRLTTGNKFRSVLDSLADDGSRMPAVTATAMKSSEAAKERAQTTEDVARWFLAGNHFDVMLPHLARWFFGYGLMAVSVVPGRGGMVKWRAHDARFVAFNADYVGGTRVVEAVVARRMDRSSLKPKYLEALERQPSARQTSPGFGSASSLTAANDVTTVMVVEYFNDERYVTGVFELDPSWDKADDEKRYQLMNQVSVRLVDDVAHDFGCCPVVVAHSHSLTGEIHGQAEAALPAFLELLSIHAKVQRYATQMVSGPIVLRGYLLNMKQGKRIEVGPNTLLHLEETANIERLPPATTSFGLQAEMDRYDADFYTAFRSSRALIGDVQQSQASGSFVDAVSTAQTDSMLAYHNVARNFVKRLLDTSMMVCKAACGDERVSAVGQFRGSDFEVEFVPSELDLGQSFSVHYGSAFGRDRSSVQLVLQSLKQAGALSLETLLAETEGVDNPSAEMARIRNEQIEQVAMLVLQQAAVDGTLAPRHVVRLMEATERHEGLLAVFEDFVADQAEAQASQQLGLPPAPGAAPPGGQPAPAMVPPPDISQFVGAPA